VEVDVDVVIVDDGAIVVDTTEAVLEYEDIVEDVLACEWFTPTVAVVLASVVVDISPIEVEVPVE
jgi:hypothetical protein